MNYLLLLSILMNLNNCGQATTKTPSNPSTRTGDTPNPGTGTENPDTNSDANVQRDQQLPAEAKQELNERAKLIEAQDKDGFQKHLDTTKASAKKILDAYLRDKNIRATEFLLPFINKEDLVEILMVAVSTADKDIILTVFNYGKKVTGEDWEQAVKNQMLSSFITSAITSNIANDAIVYERDHREMIQFLINQEKATVTNTIVLSALRSKIPLLLEDLFKAPNKNLEKIEVKAHTSEDSLPINRAIKTNDSRILNLIISQYSDTLTAVSIHRFKELMKDETFEKDKYEQIKLSNLSEKSSLALLEFMSKPYGVDQTITFITDATKKVADEYGYELTAKKLIAVLIANVMKAGDQATQEEQIRLFIKDDQQKNIIEVIETEIARREEAEQGKESSKETNEYKNLLQYFSTQCQWQIAEEF